MSSEDAVSSGPEGSEPERTEGAVHAEDAERAEGAEPARETEPAEEAVHAEADEHTVEETQHAPVEVGLQRSVRYGRIIVWAIALGAVIGAIASLFFPVEEGANYDLAQAAGLAAVAGAAIGLALGAILSLLLGIIAGRQKGAAIAVQTDVR